MLMDNAPPPPGCNRRNFVAGAATLALGTIVSLPSMVSGLVVLLDPLRRQTRSATFRAVTTLAALPADGIPRRFPIIAERINAWTRMPQASIGTVYLRRLPDNTVQAFNATCPHTGCLVHAHPDQAAFLCPCHESRFALDGSLRDSNSPSPRGLDALEVDITPAGQVRVKFQNFRLGVAEKVPLA